MIQWLRTRPSLVRVLVYAAAAVVLFAVAVGVGAAAAYLTQGGPILPLSEVPESARWQGDTPGEGVFGTTSPQREETVVEPTDAASPRGDAEYVREIGEIQADSVDRFMDSHDKLLRYDALTADDVEEMHNNQVALRELSDRAANLEPPREHGEQHELFHSAIDELNEAAQLAHDLAADPTAATQPAFEEYDRHIDEAAAYLQQSNEALNRDYETIEDAREVNLLA